MAKITYTDKADVRQSLEAASNVVRAADLNEIKQSVNALYDLSGVNSLGWVSFEENGTAEVIGSTPTKITIDGTDLSITDYAPQGQSPWNTTTNAIEPLNLGDAYTVRVDFIVSAKTTAPEWLALLLDISGSDTTPSNIVTEMDMPVYKDVPFRVSFTFSIYCLDTFVANGGRLFAYTNTGTVSILEKKIFIKRTFSGTT